jgi:hypothetical protein
MFEVKVANAGTLSKSVNFKKDGGAEKRAHLNNDGSGDQTITSYLGALTYYSNKLVSQLISL